MPSHSRSRRRGDRLLQAIYVSTLAELADTGFGKLSMERIAGRAKTGKMSLYRRWPSTQQLVVDAMQYALSNLTGLSNELPDTDDLRTDLIAVLNQIRHVMAGPAGPAMITLLSERTRHPGLLEAVQGRAFGVHDQILAVLNRAVERGEIQGDRINSELAHAGPALMIVHFMMSGRVPSEAQVAAIVNGVLLPALGRPV
ncbi:TetR/AcrR family transcriptional regulator [Actinomadura fibrosa]|uniref:TetR/AcrR family transcriptional regulator n=1 Tax=Actinomadura fibrosa TaxID=111802 RepID=A0ABW2Y092_9ACTN|nr:TetR/AcrR family transcriptional regulator [Actinomadura fibrosa]